MAQRRIAVTYHFKDRTAAQWAEDSDMGESQGLPAGPSWKVFAAFLLSGKVYE